MSYSIDQKFLIDSTHGAPKSRSRKRIIAYICIVFFVGLDLLFRAMPKKIKNRALISANEMRQEIIEDRCPIIDYARPESYCKDNSTLVKIMSDETFRNGSAKKLSGAVRIKTDVYDDSPLVSEDPKYWEDKFKPFHEYLSRTFPIVWKNFKVETVNGWGLVMTWEGSKKELKPVLLTAHQDVVPTQDSTIKDWTFPPYYGVYDGSHLWGRGSADCKNLLIGLLESIEELFKDGFRPQRTIIYGFGFDEEIGGERGAQAIGQLLLERYGRDSFYAIIDEGGQSLTEQEGVVLALPGTGEKGIANVIVGLNTPGGHSSVPPDHTSIGIMSQLVERLEENPFQAIFSPKNPTFYEYQCIASHSLTLDKKTKSAILRSEYDAEANEITVDYLTNQSLTSRYLIGTSQAIDIIHGGAKSNALPEYVEIVINHRIAIESSIDATLAKDLKDIQVIADKFDLGIMLDGQEIRKKAQNGFFTVNATSALNPAPSTPVNDERWTLLGGTIRHVYEEIAYNTLPIEYRGKPVIVAPGIATGNTDTQHYWDLTDHIYRYRPGVQPTVETHAHGVDEHILFDSHLQIIAFYYEYLQLIDSAQD